MTISIQPLDSRGHPTDKEFFSNWDSFLHNNDGFSPEEAAHIAGILTMGAGYILGGGAAGSYRLRRVEEPTLVEGSEVIRD